MTTPDKWVIVQIPNNEYKVYGSWFVEKWRLNSGITRVEEDEDYYYFYGYSGSCYKCHKQGYGVVTAYCRGVLDNILDMTKDTLTPVELLEEGKYNWGKFESGAGFEPA